jgi:hypothetical protein
LQSKLLGGLNLAPLLIPGVLSIRKGTLVRILDFIASSSRAMDADVPRVGEERQAEKNGEAPTCTER